MKSRIKAVHDEIINKLNELAANHSKILRLKIQLQNKEVSVIDIELMNQTISTLTEVTKLICSHEVSLNLVQEFDTCYFGLVVALSMFSRFLIETKPTENSITVGFNIGYQLMKYARQSELLLANSKIKRTKSLQEDLSITFDTGRLHAHRTMANNYVSVKNYSAALAILEKALRNDSNKGWIESDFTILIVKIHFGLKNYQICYNTLNNCVGITKYLDDENELPNVIFCLAIELTKLKSYDLAKKSFELLIKHYQHTIKNDPSAQNKIVFAKTQIEGINRAQAKELKEEEALKQERLAQRKLEITQKLAADKDELIKDLSALSCTIIDGDNKLLISLPYSVDELELSKYMQYGATLENDRIALLANEKDALSLAVDLLQVLRLDVRRHAQLAQNANHTTTEIAEPEKPLQALVTEQSNDSKLISEQSISSNSPPKASNAKNQYHKPVSKPEKKLSQAELLGFSKEFSNRKIFALTSPKVPIGSYFMFFDRSNATDIDSKILDAHQNCVEKGMIGHGIEYVNTELVNKELNTFKTRIGGSSKAAGFRMWSSVAQETMNANGERQVLLAFDRPHNHKSQKKLYS